MYFTTGAALQAAIDALPNSKKGSFTPFDAAYYKARYMGDYAGTLSPIEHFVQIGAALGNQPSAVFNPAYYESQYEDLQGKGYDAADLLIHFLRFGLDEGRAANPELAAFDGQAYLLKNPDVLAYVTANLAQFGGSLTNGAIAHYVKFGAQEGREPAYVGSGVFTLTEVVKEGTAGTPPVTAVYWGYNPHDDHDTVDGNGNPVPGVPADGGIPVEELVKFLTTITGLDLHELGLIDADGVTSFQNVTGLTLSNPLNNTVNGQDNNTSNELTITFADGTVINAEVALGEQYFSFLNNLLFDAQGNSRLYEKVIVAGTSGSGDSLVPIRLTPTENNGGTKELGLPKTTAGDDLIVAGRLDLLHGAYIDGGAGRNTLEIDAKGTFAQPAALLNIQEVHVNDLPNFYNDGEGGYLGDSNYPYLGDGSGSDDSYLDLSRAVNLDRLVVTAGGASGDLTIVGIRNGATTRLEGGFRDDVTLHYGQGLTGPLTVELLIGQIAGNLNFVHNTDALHLVSLGGSANSFGSEDIGGRLTNLKISGDAALYINGDLDNSFQDETPVTIDASENTKGVDLQLSGSETVTFIGSVGDDSFKVQTSDASDLVAGNADDSVTIVDTSGNNHYAVESTTIAVTVGNGNNNIELDGQFAQITAGNGNNTVAVANNASFETISVTVGNGNNAINTDDSETVSITAGNGKNVISSVRGESVTIVAGNGGNNVTVSAEDIHITTGTGNDTITVSGMGSTDIGGDANVTALLNIDTGAGVNTVVLGRDLNQQVQFGITALEGSSIAGDNITLRVENLSDLRAAQLDGITRVVLNYDISTPINSNVGGYELAPVLTLTDTQFLAIGAANFAVQGAVFSNYAQIKIIVTSSTSLTALGVDSLPRNLDLQLELQDGVTLTMTAQQLHTKVAPNGITLDGDNNTDAANGKVIITGGGVNFDPFNNSDTIKTNIDGTVYYGGSLSDDFMSGTKWYNVTVKSLVNGWDRPADVAAEVVITLDSTGTASLEQGAFSSWHTNLAIVGDQDINFTGDIQLGMLNGVATNPFTIDFSELEGVVNNFVVDNFELLAQGGGIFGNSNNGYASEVHISLAKDTANDGKGFDESDAKSLVSTGVTKYVVTTIDGPTANGSTGNVATVKLCDTVQDLEVFALRGNYNDTLVVQDAAWGLVFELQGGGTAKSEGPTGTANVGSLIANYEWEHADAVVNIVHSVAGDVRPIHVEKIDIDNADTLSIDVAGSAIIDTLVTQDATSLDVDATGNVAFVDALGLGTLDTIDASGVVGTFAATLTGAASGDDDFSFEGSAGGSSLTLLGFSADNGASDGTTTTIDGGVGGVALTIGNGTALGSDTVDLSAATLTNVSSVVLTQGSSLTLTIAQAGEIGAANFSTPGTQTASLNLTNLDDTLFVRPAFASDITVAVASVAALPSVTLNAGTDLTGIASLAVHEGTTLNLTAAQFQQLTGNGTISLIANPAITADTVINITGLTAADVANGFSLAGVVSGLIVNLQLAESVDLSAANLAGVDSITFGDNITLTLGDIQQANGVDIVGGANSTLTFTDTTGFLQTIDASGIDVDFMRLPNLLVSGNNVDYMFDGLIERVTKVIYNGIGDVVGQLQNVVIESGTTIFGDLSFNQYGLKLEVTHLTMNLQGGTDLAGDLVVSTVDVNGPVVQLVPHYLQSLVINSTGTAANLINGKTANVIRGDITPAAYGPAIAAGSRDNNLKSVTINADQAFVLEGEVLFSSHGADNTGALDNTPDDGITANNDSAAIVTLTVNGTANVTLGGVNTTDDDVDGLVVTNAGTGTLSLTVDGNNVDQDVATGNIDALSFLGSNIQLTTVNTLNLSDDVLTGVSKIKVIEGGTLTLSYTQLQSLGAANVTVIDGTADVNTDIGNATLTINGYAGGAFDATALDTHFATVNLVLVNADVTLGAGVNLTNVDSIVVQEGHTLTLTAAQFRELQGNGAISTVDTNGNGTTAPINIVITGLTQADVDAGFNLSDVNTSGGTITISLGEPSVDLGTFNASGALVSGSAAVLNGAQFVLADGQTLGLVSYAQANGLDVDGTGNTTLVYKWTGSLLTFPAQIDASGYDVTTLKALAASFTTLPVSNIEYSIDDLPSSVTVNLYADPADLGFLDPTFRKVVIEAGVTTVGGLSFNDWDPTDEVRTLDLTLSGGSELNGDLRLPTRITDKDASYGTQRYFDTLTIHSVGAQPNTIDGSISTSTAGSPLPNTDENNLLKIAIDAQQNLVIAGDIVFNSIEDVENDVVAALTVSGTANVTVQQLNVADADIGTLNIANTGTGTFTVTGASPALFDGLDTGAYAGLQQANLEVLNLSGTGNIVLGVHPNPTVTSEWGISAANLSEINASGLSGSLTIGAIRDVDSADFSFTSGTGVTKVTLTTDSLDSTNGTPGNTTDDTAGWSFDFTNAAAGSELHLANLGALTAGSKLTIEMGANGTLYIDGPGTVDLSGLVLDINQVQAIVLADGVTLQLTAAQANGLDIIAGPDTGGDSVITAKVNIVDLTNDIDPNNPVDAFDLSGIAQNIAGTITFKAGVNDVTLDKATNLGFFSVTLDTSVDDTSSLIGQTIRFQNVAQAERVVIAAGDATTGTGNSSNVVWLFDNITAPVNTRGYFSNGPLDTLNKYATPYTIGRLWLSEELINNEGGDVEQLFTTLPNTILRVDFTDLTALNVLLSSTAVDRIVEMVHFTNLNDLTFSDVGLSPVEHLHSLTLQLGGQVTIGNINLNDVVGAPGYDPASVTFTSLNIESRLALHQDHFLAAEAYVNNDNGIVEVGEYAQPNAINTIGNISVGAGLDLRTVNIDTKSVAVAGNNANDANDGAALNIGTITFGARTPATPAVLTATLDVTGANNVTIASVVVTDPDITGPVVVDLTGFSATLAAPGTSPAIVLGAQIETLQFKGGTAGLTPSVVNLGSAAVLNPNAGVTGAGLSVIDASKYIGTLNLGILALVDGTNDDSNPLVPGNDGLLKAFTLTSGSGITTATLGKDPDSANVPTLAAGSEWVIDYTNAAPGSRFTITDDVVFGTPALPGDPLPTLTLKNVDLFIQGDVDLTGVTISGLGVGIDGNSDIFVAAGNSLTITAAQAEALAGGVVIEGEGTVYIVGDASSINPGEELSLWPHVRTVNVDLSGVIISADPLVDADSMLRVDLRDQGALNDAQVAVGFNVVGSAFADHIEASNLNDTIDGGAGNDELLGQAGSDTFLVTAGTDTILDLTGNGAAVVGDDDVLVVSAGATALATNISQFIATADTVNNGTATLSTVVGGGTINVSAAGGANGFNLTGDIGADVLIGGAGVDVINGGGNTQVANPDTLTGNGGADTFFFNVGSSTPIQPGSVTNIFGVDREVITLTADGADNGNEVFSITYVLNGLVRVVTIDTTAGAYAGLDVTNADDVLTAIKSAFDGLPGGSGVTVTLDLATDTAVFTALNGAQLTVGNLALGAGTFDALAGASANGTDVPQESLVTLQAGAVGTELATVGETYRLGVTFTNGGTNAIEYVVQAGDTLADVAQQLDNLLTAQVGVAVTITANANATIDIVDAAPDNGGFTVSTSVISAVTGSGASNLGATDITTADTITDFATTVDKVQFEGMADGIDANYEEAAGVANYGLALAAANLMVDGTVRYYLTSVNESAPGAADGYGVLFFDANGDGGVDGVVKLTGVTAANFDYSDIGA